MDFIRAIPRGKFTNQNVSMLRMVDVVDNTSGLPAVAWWSYRLMPGEENVTFWNVIWGIWTKNNTSLAVAWWSCLVKKMWHCGTLFGEVVLLSRGKYYVQFGEEYFVYKIIDTIPESVESSSTFWDHHGHFVQRDHPWHFVCLILMLKLIRK